MRAAKLLRPTTAGKRPYGDNTYHVKETVLKRISRGAKSLFLGKSKWRIGDRTVHVRWRTSPKAKGIVYSFNINPNTLSADYEVWICGDASRYCLFPVDLMRRIYEDPDSYPDKRHPEIRVAEVDMIFTHMNHRSVFRSHPSRRALAGAPQDEMEHAEECRGE